MLDDLEPHAGTPSEVLSPEPQNVVAPRWHTALVVLLVSTASIAGAKSAKNFPLHGHASNLVTYVASIVMEWLLAGIVLWGLRLRRTPLRDVLGESKPGINEWFVDMGVAGAFWIIALIFLGVLASLLKPLHLHPENIRDTVSKLAPNTPLEMLAWAGLCITAGICEEFIFRGYLQIQLSRVSHRIWIGVAGSALVFGLSHGYEGWSGMLLIVAFGALFSMLRLVRGNVRAGMFAHAWHDFFSGVVLYLLAHHKLLP